MKAFRLLYLTILCLGFAYSQSHATHIKGGDITYTCISANTYSVSLTLFRDCSGIALGSTANVQVQSPTCGNISYSLSLAAGSPQIITPACPTAPTVCNGGTTPGQEAWVYTGTITVGACNDFTISYNTCCRNSAVYNATNPSSTSFYISTTLDNTLSVCNSSPTFNYNMPFYACANDTIQLTQSALDANGDSLVYSLAAPMNSASSSVSYSPGFSAASPLNGSINIDAATGDITMYSNSVGVALVGIKVEEYRNGMKIGEVLKEFQLDFYNCSSNDSPNLIGVNGIVGSYSATVTATDTLWMSLDVFDSDITFLGTQAIAASWTNNLPGAMLTVSNNTPMLMWIPAVGDTGVHHFAVSVNDGACPLNGVATHAYQITVTKAGTPPPPPPNNSFYVSDTAVVGTSINANCWTLTGNYSTFQILNYPNHITIDTVWINPGCVLYTADSISTDTLILEACNALQCDTIYLTITTEQGVWPGDTDTSQVVNNFDLLNIGLAYGSTGIPRQNQNIAWNGYRATDWGTSTPLTNVDYKHIDTDGDGAITTLDTVAIFLNWGYSYSYNKSGGSGVPLYLDTQVPVDSNIIGIPIMLGDMANPANDFYGIAYSISYDTALVKPGSAHIVYDTTWVGTSGNLLSLHKDFYQQGEIQTAITRTDGNNKSGMGRIGTLYLVIQDDILQKNNKYFQFEVHSVKMISASENEVLVSGGTDTLVVVPTNTNTLNIDHTIKVFPNPTSHQITIQATDVQLEQIMIFDAKGKLLSSLQQPRNGMQLPISQYDTGIYILKIKTDKGIVNKKIVIMR